MAQDQNPLTALPGNRAIGGFIADRCSDGDESRFFCYCDFDNFKPFNDKYGFNAGDHAITLFSALMRRYFLPVIVSSAISAATTSSSACVTGR